MKELSIEEKARRYDEAIEIAKEINNEQRAQPFNVMTRVFPELKESEDDKIRKEILDYIKTGTYQKKWVEWLEKQGEHTKFRESIQIGDKVTRNKDGMLVNLSQLNRVAKKDEKQGEQKPDNEIKPKYKEGDTIEYIGERKELDTDEHIILYVYDDMYITTWGKKIPFKFQDDYKLVDKQKPVDKVEPKFKVGDWIIKDNYSAQQVKELREEAYILDGSISGVETLPKKYIENNYHLWTIQDAKAGDVLSYRNGQWIFIYKDIVTKDTFKYYALLSERGVSINDTAFSLLLDGITPTTKEQYNQLFQKMKEAGYEWVGDKLELRKIEQKLAEPTLDIEIPFGAKDSELVGKSITIPDGFYTAIEGNQVVIRKGEKPAEWSDEDINMFGSVLSTLGICANNPQIPAEVRSIHKKEEAWFNELYHRLEPQPKIEWSEEDKKLINRICADLRGYALHKRKNDLHDAHRIEEEADWLKSLRPNHWKPSDEQMVVLNDIIINGHLSNANERILKGLQEQLKAQKGE